MPSLLSHIVKLGFRLYGVKKAYETDSPPYLRMRRINYGPAEVLRSFDGAFKHEVLDGFHVYTYTPKNVFSKAAVSSTKTLIWFHGGGFVLGPFKEHFSHLKKLCDFTGCVGILVDYPKAPEKTYVDTFRFLDGFHDGLKKTRDVSNLFFIGDSAGGNIAVTFALHLKEKGEPTPRTVFSLSPCLDLKLSQPETPAYDAADPFLSAPGIQAFVKWYSGGADLESPLLSPLYVPLQTFPFALEIYSGTLDILHPGNVAFQARFQETNPRLRLHTYPGMMHAWPLMPMPEAWRVIREISEAIRETN